VFYWRFAKAVLSLAPMEGIDVDFDLGIEQDDSGWSDGPRTWFVLYTDNLLWRQFLMTKDLQPKLMRWYLQLEDYNFVVCNKNGVHMLTDPESTLKHGQALDLKRALLGKQFKPHL